LQRLFTFYNLHRFKFYYKSIFGHLKLLRDDETDLPVFSKQTFSKSHTPIFHFLNWGIGYKCLSDTFSLLNLAVLFFVPKNYYLLKIIYKYILKKYCSAC